MRVLLPTLGSTGDVHPFLAIGLEARARGHDVEIMTNPVYGPMVLRAGLGFHPIGTAEQHDAAFRSPKLWHPIHGLGVFWRRMARFAIEPVYQRIAEQAARGPCVVLATPLILGARLANEKLNTPLVSAYTAATMLRSCEDPLTMAHWRVPRWIPAALRAQAWRVIDQWKLEPMVAGDLPPMRQKLGLPTLKQSVFGQWAHSPRMGVTLFPPWFAPAASDWPPQVVQAGFPLYDGDGLQGLDAGLLKFLDAGEPPIVFTPGSAMGHGEAFFSAALRSCNELGRRGVFLTADPGAIPETLPTSIHQSSYAPLGLLLPRAAALVHHGGVGTSAQAMRAAIPQLLSPMGFDQFDNAMRLEVLGVAATVARRDRALKSMTPNLHELLGSQRVARACRTAASRLDHDPTAPGVVCDLLEAAQ